MSNKIILLIKDSTTQKSIGYLTTLLTIFLSLSLNLISCTCSNPPLEGRERAIVNEDKSVQLVLKDIKYDQATNKISYTIANQSKESAEGVTLYWQILTPGAQIKQSGKVVNKADIGLLDAGIEKGNQTLGQLYFGADPSVEISFWLALTDDASQYSQQVKIFPNYQVSLSLIAVGPTFLTGDSNRKFIAKIEKKAGSGLVAPEQIVLNIKLILGNSAKIIYDSKEITSLLGTDLTNISSHISFMVDPGAEEKVRFELELVYAGKPSGKLLFNWYKEAPKDLFEVIERRDLEVMENFLKIPDNQTRLNVTKGLGHTPLIYVIESFYSEDEALPFIQLLLKSGAQANSPNDKTGMTPLHYAVKNNREKITELLLGVAHIDVSIQDKVFNTPFHVASYVGNERILEKLLNKLSEANTKKVLNTLNSSGETCLQNAVYAGLQSSVSLLLQKGIDPNIFNPQLGSPLYWGVIRSNLPIVAELIKFKADVNAVNKEGYAPLHAAFSTGNLPIIRLLIQNGAKKDLVNKAGKDPVACFTKFISETDKKEIERLLNS